MADPPYQLSRIELWVQTWLRVPPYPKPPEGSPDSIQVFHAGRNYYVWCVLVWAASNILVFAGLAAAYWLVSRFLPRWPEWAQIAWRAVEWLAAIAFAASAALTFISQRLNYSLRWYMVTDRSLRIRNGVLSMHELTMTFCNIQEIRVSAGPLQNLLKLADVEVHSAGGGASANGGGGRHVARFEGVSNANAIRDLMVERLRQYRDSGLGEASPHPPASEDRAIDAARLVLAEVQALRATFARGAD